MSHYNVVAAEYYDGHRHPTCANFRTASRLLISRLVTQELESAVLWEIGAGMSLVAEVMLGRGLGLCSTVLTDESLAMLAYSYRYRAEGAQLAVALAASLPTKDETVDWLVASLGDPYNDASLWTEAQRVLKPGGRCVFTTPSYDWARAFRADSSHGEFFHADFELTNGRHTFLPSLIYSDAEQQQLIVNAGLSVVEVQKATIGDLTLQVLSPKLHVERGSDASVVTGYLARKPGRRN